MYTSNGSVRRQRPKVTDEIIEALRSEIVTGKLKVGDRLPTEKELAHNFGVSQPSVREAIRALEVMGLVEVRHGAGVFVTNDGIFGLTSAFLNLLQLENVGILEVQQLRRLFGIESAQLAAATVKPDQLSKIEAALQKSKRSIISRRFPKCTPDCSTISALCRRRRIIGSYIRSRFSFPS
jgi:DNA-binding FadR family transcriptional regulator